MPGDSFLVFRGGLSQNEKFSLEAEDDALIEN